MVTALQPVSRAERRDGYHRHAVGILEAVTAGGDNDKLWGLAHAIGVDPPAQPPQRGNTLFNVPAYARERANRAFVAISTAFL